MSSSNPIPLYYQAHDRFSNARYRVDQRTYHYIIDLVQFYHDSIYWLPDDEVVKVLHVKDNRHITQCNVPVNHLVFEH